MIAAKLTEIPFGIGVALVRRTFNVRHHDRPSETKGSGGLFLRLVAIEIYQLANWNAN
jgi:hypothetical protein